MRFSSPAIGLLAVSILFFGQVGFTQQDQKPNLDGISIDTSLTRLAGTYFKEMKLISDKDDGRFWGIHMYGAVMIVDVDKRIIYANEQDSINSLHKSGDVYVGILPDSEAIANTSIYWSGKRWTMLMLESLSKNYLKRDLLVFHELFHSVQDQLGLPMQGRMADFLDQREGRIFFRLELRALRSALVSSGSTRKKHLQNALNFRMYRYQLFPGAKEIEAGMEWNEGLAEFTGMSLSNINVTPLNNYLIKLLDSAEVRYPSFIRSFAYITGPVYGQLLTEKSPGWQRGINSKDDFTKLLLKKYQLAEVPDLERSVAAVLKNYDGERIKIEEKQKEETRIERIRQIRKKYMEDTVLVIPFSNRASGSFGPNNIIKVSDTEIFYEYLEVVDSFGRISINNGCVKDYSKRQVRVSLRGQFKPGQLIFKTGDWELQLNKGWKLAPGPDGNLMVLAE